MSWLQRYQTQFIRLNIDDFLYKPSIVTQTYFVLNKLKYYYSDFKVVWIRRLPKYLPFVHFDKSMTAHSNADINNFNQNEWLEFLKFFLSMFPSENMINNYQGYFLTKLEQILIAKEIGLNAPQSLFTNDLSLLDKSNKYIHKPATNLGYIQDNTGFLSAYTETLKEGVNFENLLPSFIQVKLDGIYEIRVNFINNVIYSCGMIKSVKEKIVDIKKQESVRYSPVLIDKRLNTKIVEFMQSIKFQIGTLDIIKSQEDNHFIEMNPIGKFSHYSDVCCFGLEQHIAKFLISKS